MQNPNIALSDRFALLNEKDPSSADFSELERVRAALNLRRNR